METEGFGGELEGFLGVRESLRRIAESTVREIGAVFNVVIGISLRLLSAPTAKQAPLISAEPQQHLFNHSHILLLLFIIQKS